MKTKHLTADVAKTINNVYKKQETKLDKIYSLILDMSRGGCNELSYYVSENDIEFKKLKKGGFSFTLTKKESETLIRNGFKLNRDSHDIRHGQGCDIMREIHW